MPKPRRIKYRRKVPAGYMTIGEIAEKSDLSQNTLYARITETFKKNPLKLKTKDVPYIVVLGGWQARPIYAVHKRKVKEWVREGKELSAKLESGELVYWKDVAKNEGIPEKVVERLLRMPFFNGKTETVRNRTCLSPKAREAIHAYKILMRNATIEVAVMKTGFTEDAILWSVKRGKIPTEAHPLGPKPSKTRKRIFINIFYLEELVVAKKENPKATLADCRKVVESRWQRVEQFRTHLETEGIADVAKEHGVTLSNLSQKLPQIERACGELYEEIRRARVAGREDPELVKKYNKHALLRNVMGSRIESDEVSRSFKKYRKRNL